MERDDNLKGQGNSYTTPFRMNDPRLAGRWWSTDPITKPWESPYAGYGNNPVSFVDPMGLDPVGDKAGDTWKKAVKDNFGIDPDGISKSFENIKTFVSEVKPVDIERLMGSFAQNLLPAIFNDVVGAAKAAFNLAAAGQDPVRAAEYGVKIAYLVSHPQEVSEAIQEQIKEKADIIKYGPDEERGKLAAEITATILESIVISKGTARLAKAGDEVAASAESKTLSSAIIKPTPVTSVDEGALLLPGIKVTPNSKAIMKHARDYFDIPVGQNPTKVQKKSIMGLINLTYNNRNFIKQGIWKDEANALFISNGQQVLVTKPDGTLLSILKNGETNGNFKRAATIWEKK